MTDLVRQLESEGWIKINVLAKKLGVGYRTFWRWAREGKIRKRVILKRAYANEAEVREFILRGQD